jgi:hypothetical protein
VEQGNLIVHTAGGVASAEIVDLNITNTSLRTELRILDGSAAFVYVRSQSLPSGPNGYAAFISADGKAGILYDGSSQVLAETDTDFDPTADYVTLQIDAIDDVVSLWLWNPGDEMPAEPVVSVPDQSGFTGWVGVGGWGSPSNVAYRYIHIGQTSIILGDFDGNGMLDMNDVDALSAAILVNDSRFDVNHDDVVDTADLKRWVTDLRNTWLGDANIDGEFNSGDLVRVFQRGEYEDAIARNSTWSEGDWNGDGEFDTGDLVTAFQSGGFEKGPRAASVPEPGISILIFAAGIVLGRRQWLVVDDQSGS